MSKAITTADIKLPESAKRTKEWDPSKAITMGNIEKARGGSAAKAGKADKAKEQKQGA